MPVGLRCCIVGPKQVLHSAEHPHVLKIMETFASSDDMLDHYHRCYTDYLEGVFDFRAAVNPTVQTYTPLAASLRPSLSAGCVFCFCLIFSLKRTSVFWIPLFPLGVQQ